jgi:hypothetical protein
MENDNSIDLTDYRFFICTNGSVVDLDEIYFISCPLEGYGEHEGNWHFKVISRHDGKPVSFMYTEYNQCLAEQRRCADQLIYYRAQKIIQWVKE